MKLYRRRADAAQPVHQPVASSLTVQQEIPAEPFSAGIKLALGAIALRAEQKEILDQHAGGKVARNWRGPLADTSAANDALKASRIIQFPN